MVYDVNAFIADFSARTMKNLNHIENEVYAGASLYEVTQLINSLLGLVVIPVEVYKANRDVFTDYNIENIASESFTKISAIIKRKTEEGKLYCDYKKEKDDNTSLLKVTSFIKHIRNSIAHGGNKGLHFFPVEKNQDILGVYFYDACEYSKLIDGKRTTVYVAEFCVYLSIEDIKELVSAISELFILVEENTNSLRLNIDFSHKERLLNKLLDTQRRKSKLKSTINL